MNEEQRRRNEEGEGPAPDDIEERTLRYGVRVVRLFRALQGGSDRAGWIVGKQFLWSATSVGANVAEARAAESRRDFVHKIQIAQKEARESLYWLRLFTEAGIVPREKVTGLTQETDEILRILVAIARNTKRNATGPAWERSRASIPLRRRSSSVFRLPPSSVS